MTTLKAELRSKDAKLGELIVVAQLVLDQREMDTRRWIAYLDDAGSDAGRRELRELTEQLHT